MSVGNNGRFPAGSAERRMLRAAIALGMATMLGTFGVSTANAESSTLSASAGVSTSEASAASNAEVAAVEQLKQTYFHDVDTKNWAGLRTLLAPDVVVDTSGSVGPVFFSRDTFIPFLQLTLGALQTHHQGYDPKITLTSPTTADVVWSMDDRLVFANIIGVHGYGHYTDRDEKLGGTWVIDSSKLTRTHIDVILPFLNDFVLFSVPFSNPLVQALGSLIQAISYLGAPPKTATETTSASSVPAEKVHATSSASTVKVSTMAVTTSAPASTKEVRAAAAAPSAAEAVEAGGAHKVADIPAHTPADPVTIVDWRTQNADSSDRAPSELGDPKADAQPKKVAEPKADVKAVTTAKADVEAKKTAAPKESGSLSGDSA
jgi:hypothetical protein